MTAKPNILVLGAGVSGLTCALSLKERGFDVTVVAEKFAPLVTSVVAGALWEWPPAVCGHHHDQLSLNRSKAWCLASLRRFRGLAHKPGAGVFLRRATFYFHRPVAEDPQQFAKMNELRTHVDQFIHDAALIAANKVNPAFGTRDAYAHLSPMIDTDIYMAWLLGEVQQSGCRVLREPISGSLRDQEQSLRNRFAAEAIVNCTGLGARELAVDEVSPLRGAVIRLRNDGQAMPRMTEAHCVAHHAQSSRPDFIFIVPRGNDTLLLGGLAEPDQWNLDIGLDNYEPIRTMYRRCLEFLPALKSGAIDASDPVRVGLRPVRRQNVRLEHEPGTRIIHNYGHGGSGVTLSWGCAAEVADTVERILE
jgi:D-amino-acid oxidase